MNIHIQDLLWISKLKNINSETDVYTRIKKKNVRKKRMYYNLYAPKIREFIFKF